MGAAFNANEFKTVDDLYNKGLGRAGDQGGLDYWRGQFGDSIDQNEFNTFKASAMPEYQANQAANMPASQYSNLDQLYQGVLGRSADQTGSEYWRSQFGDTIDSAEEAQFRQSAQAELNTKKNADLAAQQNKQFDPYGNNPYANSQNPYIQAAQQNAAGNLSGAQMATAANRVNQNTPYQSLQYRQTGVDAQGNPIWTADQTLAEGFQKPLSNIQANIAAQTANPFDVSKTQNQLNNTKSPEFAQMGAAPQLQTQVAGAGMEGWDKANELLMSRLRPQMEQRDAALDVKLRNQGIMPGTEAYNRARLAAGQVNNDLMTQAQLAGSQVQNQMFNQNLQGGQFTNQAMQNQNSMGLQNLGFNNATAQQGFGNSMSQTAQNNAAQQNNFAQNLAGYNNPLQQLNAFTTGTNPGYVNSYNQQAVGGPDYLGAYTTAQAASIAAQNAANAQNASDTSGMYGLGSAALMGAGGLAGLGSTIGSGVKWLLGE